MRIQQYHKALSARDILMRDDSTKFDGMMTRKQRVVALTTSYPLRPGGCAGLFIQNLYRSLSTAHFIDVICPADSEAAPAIVGDEIGADICVHAVHYAPRAWRTLAQQSGGMVPSLRGAPWRALLLPALLIALFWRCLVRAGNADLIHANWAICGALAGIVGRLRGRPVVTTLRGDDVARATRAWLDRVLLALAVRNSRTVVCVSNEMAKQVRGMFPYRAADIHACLNGVDEAFFRIDRVDSETNALQVLSVGSLIPRKGFDILIEAVARARRRDCINVCVIGEGPEREFLQALAARNDVATRFHFVGEVLATEMPIHFAAANVFVLPSRSEGRPNVVVEALASGLPVVCTNLPGVRGMVEHGGNGWLVAVDDADGLADALDQACADGVERCRRGLRARESAQAGIGTWADTARCYEGLFRAVLESDRKVRT